LRLKRTDLFAASLIFVGGFLVSLDRFEGKKVIASGGQIVGEVKDAEINPNTWHVTHLQVKLTSAASGKFRFKKRFRTQTVCMPVNLVSTISDVVTIQTSLDELNKNTHIYECAP